MSNDSPMRQSDLVQFANLLCHIRTQNPNLDVGALAASMRIEHNDLVGIFATANAVVSRAHKTSSIAPTVLVKHWSRYKDSSPMTHKVEVEDELIAAGRIAVFISAVDAGVESPLCGTMEVSHDPHGHGRPVPSAHFAVDGEGYAFSLFQVDGTVLLVPEEGVEVVSSPTARGQSAYRIAWKE